MLWKKEVRNFSKVKKLSTKPADHLHVKATLIFLFVFVFAIQIYTRFPRSHREDPESLEPVVETEEELPYHDTLILDSDLPVHERLWKSELIWERSIEKRDQWEGPIQLADFVNLFYPAFNCPHMLERVGDAAEGTWICGLELFEDFPDCSIYSFGTLAPSFQEEIFERTRSCKIFAYDFDHNKFDGSEGNPSDNRMERHTIKAKDNNFGWSLASLLKENGHGWIDMLKVDMGEVGFGVLEGILKNYKEEDEVLPFGQLLITLPLHGVSQRLLHQYWEWFERLEVRGLRLFHTRIEHVTCNTLTRIESLVVQYSFLNLRGRHVLITNSR